MTGNGKSDNRNGSSDGAEAATGRADPGGPSPVAVEEAIRICGEVDPQGLADAMGPAVGRAMRRAFFGGFRNLVKSFNRFVLYTATWRGIKWRAEAMWTGRPFSKVVAERTVVRPLRQVLLIHRRTGLLLGQAQQGGFDTQDGDMVSGMLTAIQDFVDDSFRSAKSGRLETVRFGAMNLCIEQGDRVVLAGILDGEVTEPFRQSFRRTLDRIQGSCGAALESFDGDTGLLGGVRPYLESCLRTQRPMEEHILPGTWLLLAAPIVAALVWAGFQARDRAEWRGVIDQVESMPGIVLLDQGHRGGRYYLLGLRDPLAADPSVVIEDSVLRDRVTIRWEPYNSVSQPMVLRRAIKMLDPPPSVVLTIEGERLKARGTAPQDWIDLATLLTKGICGVQGIDVDEVAAAGEIEDGRWNRAVEQVSASPGIVVIDQGQRDGRFFIRGLRDPLAQDPNALLAGLGFGTDAVNAIWELYETGDPKFVLERVRQVLDPPNEVTLKYRDGVVTAVGKAPHEWVRKAEILSRTVRGVTRFDTEHLTDVEETAFRAARDRLEATTFRVFSGAGDLMAGQASKMDLLVEDVRELSVLARRLNRAFTVEIRGHTPATGSEDTDASASLGLARRFLELLQRRTVDPSVFATRGMGSDLPADEDSGSPHVREATISFSVVL